MGEPVDCKEGQGLVRSEGVGVVGRLRGWERYVFGVLVYCGACALTTASASRLPKVPDMMLEAQTGPKMRFQSFNR